MRKFPTNCGSCLRYFLGGAEPVEPRHQRRMQARGHRQRWRGNHSCGPSGFTLALREAGDIIDRVVGNKLFPRISGRTSSIATDGIPLFVEEMTKAVLEAAVPAD